MATALGSTQMWKDAEAHRFDCLLFWSLDRLTREGTFATLQYLRRLSDLGIKFKSYTEQYVDFWAFSEKQSLAFLQLLRNRNGSESASAPRPDWRVCAVVARNWDALG
jgi:DNA invertase Pin-like site-specific DNA recombinase